MAERHLTVYTLAVTLRRIGYKLQFSILLVVIRQSAIRLCVILLGVNLLSIIHLCVIILSVTKLSVAKLRFILLIAMLLCVARPSIAQLSFIRQGVILP
jgi:hypothetical protein